MPYAGDHGFSIEGQLSSGSHEQLNRDRADGDDQAWFIQYMDFLYLIANMEHSCKVHNIRYDYRRMHNYGAVPNWASVDTPLIGTFIRIQAPGLPVHGKWLQHIGEAYYHAFHLIRQLPIKGEPKAYTIQYWSINPDSVKVQEWRMRNWEESL